MGAAGLVIFIAALFAVKPMYPNTPWALYLLYAAASALLAMAVGFSLLSIMKMALAAIVKVVRDAWSSGEARRAQYRRYRLKAVENQQRQELAVMERYGVSDGKAGNILVLLTMLVSGITTCHGMRLLFVGVSEHFVVQWVIPVGYALVSSLAVFIAWTKFMRICRLQGMGGFIRALPVFVLIMAPAIFSISTLLGAVGFASDPALKEHFFVSLDKLEQSAFAINDRRLGEAEITPMVRVFATEMRQLAGDEASGGVLTGFAGRGQIAGYLNSAAIQLEAALAELESAAVDRKGSAMAIADKIRDIRLELQKSTKDEPFRYQVAGFQSDIQKLRDGLAELAASNPLLAVESAAKSLETLTARAESVAGNVAKSQRRVMETLQASSAQKGEQIRSQVEEIRGRGSLDVPQVKTITRLTAVFKYIGAVWSGWAAQAAVDYFALVLCLVYLLERKDSHAALEDAESLSSAAASASSDTSPAKPVAAHAVAARWTRRS